jgi:putative PIG3 family NAD(P)H quinone oxidoreductase
MPPAVAATVGDVRAVEITRFGPPEVLEFAEVPDPVAGPGEVLVEVAATAVNRADLMQREGHYPPPPGASVYPGLECSGRISALGPDVAGWHVGQEVCALLAGGGYAEQVAVPVGQLMPIPRGVDLIEAAALPEVACTVWSMVFQRGRLSPGEAFLVHGGSSGIGTMAIQLAVAFGARVFTTAGSAAKLQACRDLGAEVAINYHDQDFVDVVAEATDGGVDVILDNMGAKYFDRNLQALAPEGRLVIVGFQGGTKAEINLTTVMSKRLSVSSAGLRARSVPDKAAVVAATTAAVWPKLESGDVRPIVDRVVPLADAAEAHRYVETSSHIGKVVLKAR